MLKKLIATCGLALPLTCWGWGSGYYVGGALGGDSIYYFEKTHIQQQSTEGDFDRFSVIEEDPKGAQGLFANLIGGYGWVCNMFYLGGEANLNGSTALYKKSNKEFDHPEKQVQETEFRTLPNWGLSAISGVIFPENTLIYGRFGYAGGFLRVITNDSSLRDFDKVISGVRFGLGIEKRVYKNFSVRFDYSHIQYQKSSTFVTDPSSGKLTDKQTSITPEDNQVEFALIYRFC